MPQKTLDGKDVEETSIWEENSFVETMGPESKTKMRTFHMKHNEEMNYNRKPKFLINFIRFSSIYWRTININYLCPPLYNCKQCNSKISAHNKDWHAGLCDKCFGKLVDDG